MGERITRYEDGYGGILPEKDGTWVMYDDHVAAIRELQLHAGALEHQMAELRDLCATLRHQSEKAQAVISEKDAEIERWRDRLDTQTRNALNLLDRAERAETQRDEYKADAERYRWIRRP